MSKDYIVKFYRKDDPNCRWHLHFPDTPTMVNHSAVYPTINGAWNEAKRLAQKVNGRAIKYDRRGFLFKVEDYR